MNILCRIKHKERVIAVEHFNRDTDSGWPQRNRERVTRRLYRCVRCGRPRGDRERDALPGWWNVFPGGELRPVVDDRQRAPQDDCQQMPDEGGEG